MEAISAPLHVPRTGLIDALQARLDEAKAKAEAKQATDRETIATVLTYADAVMVHELARVVADAAGNPSPGFRESDVRASEAITEDPTIARALRVLRLASDETVEIVPTDDVYRLV